MASPPAQRRVGVTIEVGHQSSSKENRTSGPTHDWNAFVRGIGDADISHFIEKVVFKLHDSYKNPERVLMEPPYEVHESGYGSFKLRVTLHFRDKKSKPYEIQYNLHMLVVGMPPLNVTENRAIIFDDPSEDFEKKLLLSGSVVFPSPASTNLHEDDAMEPISQQDPSLDSGEETEAVKSNRHQSSDSSPKRMKLDTNEDS